ncbi:MAG: hypothetical protein QM749_13100 [Aquabacterium sp.]
MHWRTHTPRTGLILLALSAALSARAGVIGNGNWSPSGCGDKPQPPTLDLRNADDYNRSVGGVNAYRQAIRAYLDCLVKEANADMQNVSRSAGEAQRLAKQADEKILADVKLAEEKFK